MKNRFVETDPQWEFGPDPNDPVGYGEEDAPEDTLESHEHGLTDTDLDNLHQHLRELKGEV